MAKTRHTAEVKYVAQMQGLVAEVRRAGQAQETAIHGVTAAIQRQVTGWRGLGNDLVRLRQSYLAVHGAMSAVAGTALRLVEAAGQEETQIRMLDRSLRLHGTTLAAHGGEVDALIERFTSMTAFGDDAVRSTLTALGRLTAGTTRSFAELSSYAQLALDIAAETGREGADAAQIIGQALAGNVRSLRELLPELAVSLRGMEDGADQAAAAMAGLHRVFDGAAASISAAEQTIGEARNRIADLREDAGSFLSGAAVGLLDFFGQIGEMLPRLADRITGTGDGFMRMVDAARAAAELQRDLMAGGMGPGVVPPTQYMDFTSPEEAGGLTVTGSPGRGPGGRGGGGRSQARRGEMWGASLLNEPIAALAEKRMEEMREALSGLLDVKLEAWDRERALEEARTATLEIEAGKRKQMLMDEAATQRTQSAAALSDFKTYSGGVMSVYHAMAGNSRGYAGTMAGLAAVEAIWRYAIGDVAGGLGATAASIGYARHAASGGFGASRGGRGGARTAYSGTGNPSQAGALLGAPDSSGRTVNLSIVFQDSVMLADDGAARRMLGRAIKEMQRRGEL